MAIIANHAKAVGWLLDAGANLEARLGTDGRDGTALFTALRYRKEAIVEMLVCAGADINASHGDYNDALQAASWHGSETSVRLLLSAGANVNSGPGKIGTALYAAVKARHENIVEILVNAGAHINATHVGHGDALQEASYSGSERSVRILLDAGADVNAEGRARGTALCAAINERHERVANMLIDAGANVHEPQCLFQQHALHTASHLGLESTVRALIKAGADLDVQRGRGGALHAACRRGHETVVNILLEAGADIDLQNQLCQGPVNAAWAAGYTRIALGLIERGAEMNTKSHRLYGFVDAALSSYGHSTEAQGLDYGKIIEKLVARGFYHSPTYRAKYVQWQEDRNSWKESRGEEVVDEAIVENAAIAELTRQHHYERHSSDLRGRKWLKSLGLKR